MPNGTLRVELMKTLKSLRLSGATLLVLVPTKRFGSDALLPFGVCRLDVGT